MKNQELKLMESLKQIKTLLEGDRDSILERLEQILSGKNEDLMIETLEPILNDKNKGLIMEILAAIPSGRLGAIERNFDLFQIILALVYLCSLIFYEEFRYPQPQVGRYDVVSNFFEQLRWAYRRYFNQLEAAERGSGIEEYFRRQVLEFPLPEGFEETVRIDLASGGDLLAVGVLSAENMPHVFDAVKDFYFSADIICANLESTVYDGAPWGVNGAIWEAARMNTGEKEFRLFYDDGNGINFFSTANNHCFDYGSEGLLATLDLLDKYGAGHCGTYRTPEEQEDVLIIEKGGVKIAVISYTMDLNGRNPKETQAYMVSEVHFNDEVCDIAKIERHVAKAKEKGADIIVACCHWNWEFEMYPHRNVMDTAHRIIELGVDVILGTHPHVAQPMERYTYQKDGAEKRGLIIYSAGDFLANHAESRNSRISYIAKFDIAKGKENGTDVCYITDLRILPVYMLNEQIEGGRYNCRMLRFSDVLADTGASGTYRYGLTAREREWLPHQAEVVLHQILLPENHEGLLAE